MEVYTDKGIIGTSTKKREGFNCMIQDALAGKIDLIITKSVSRFARNKVDTLTTIRKLKERGMEVNFEEQNIHTLDSKAEVLLTIMSNIAQEESGNISENVTWGMRKWFADGRVSMPYGQFMGHRRSADGSLEIVEAETMIVRTIFRRFLEGAIPAIIARELNNAEIPCPSRKGLLSEDAVEAAKGRKKTARWSPSTIESILTNEKYKDDAILQKTYCTDYIRKTFVVNDGSEIPKYYAQICGGCGSFYGSKVWHSTDAYRRTIWRCNNKYDGDRKCSTPHVTQEELERAFVSVMQRVLQEKTEILAACRVALHMKFDTAELDWAAKRLEEQVLGIAQRVRKMVEENARVQMNQEEYQQEYNVLAAEYEKTARSFEGLQSRSSIRRIAGSG